MTKEQILKILDEVEKEIPEREKITQNKIDRYSILEMIREKIKEEFNQNN